MAGYEPDPELVDHQVTKKPIAILEAATDAEGRQLEVHVLKSPSVLRPDFESDDFAAGYINFYVCNGGVIIPAFGDADAEAAARDTVQELFPAHEIVRLNGEPMPKLLTSTPHADGFRMPGEFEKHDGCWMLWPDRPDTYRLGAKPAQAAYVETAVAISQFEKVTMGVSSVQFKNARAKLPAHIRVVEMSYNDAWIRDSGPIFVNNGIEVRAVVWDFNAWGGLKEGLYFPWDQDTLVPSKVAEIEWLNRYKANMVLEGGAITVDGEGTLITTAQCLLNPNRNPGLTTEEIEKYLYDFLGIEKTIWIPRGSLHDETDGHVDGVCAFIRPGEVVVEWTDDQSDPEYDIIREAYETLQNATDAQGRKLKVNKLINPAPIYVTEEETAGIDLVEGVLPRLAGTFMGASYVNFYLANGGCVVPLYNDPADANALETLQKLMPERKVVGIKSGREILLGGGMVHCITQQQPSANSK